MPNVFAGAVALLVRLIPASESRRRELRLGRSHQELARNAADTASWIREAELIVTRAWLNVTPSWIQEAEATAAQEWLADGRTA